MNFSYAWILLFAGEFKQAMEHARKTLKLYPNSLHSYFVMGWGHIACGRPAEAIAAFEKAVGISRDIIGLGYLGHAYGLAGRRNEALAILNELIKKSATEDVPLTSLAYLYIGLGDFDKAFELLYKCFEDRDGRLFWLQLTIFCDAFCSDPRFRQLISGIRAAAGELVETS